MDQILFGEPALDSRPYTRPAWSPSLVFFL